MNGIEAVERSDFVERASSVEYRIPVTSKKTLQSYPETK